MLIDPVSTLVKTGSTKNFSHIYRRRKPAVFIITELRVQKEPYLVETKTEIGRFLLRKWIWSNSNIGQQFS